MADKGQTAQKAVQVVKEAYDLALHNHRVKTMAGQLQRVMEKHAKDRGHHGMGSDKYGRAGKRNKSRGKTTAYGHDKYAVLQAVLLKKGKAGEVAIRFLGKLTKQAAKINPATLTAIFSRKKAALASPLKTGLLAITGTGAA
jgi:hypothetical protein